MISQYKDISTLSTLLTESQEAQDSYSEIHNQPPVASAPSKVVVSAGNQVNKPETETSSPTKSIWETEEVPSEDSLAAVNDSRPCPRYEFSYKQSVGTEDTMLGLGVSYSNRLKFSDLRSGNIILFHLNVAGKNTSDL